MEERRSKSVITLDSVNSEFVVNIEENAEKIAEKEQKMNECPIYLNTPFSACLNPNQEESS